MIKPTTIMKYLFSCFCLLFLCVSISHAQKPITLTDDSVKFTTQYFPGIWVSIPEVKPETLETSWIKAIQKSTKSKVSKHKNELTLFGSILTDITAGNINIMSQIDNRDTVTHLFMCIETTRNTFITKTSEEYDNMRNYLTKFAKAQYIIAAKEQLSAEMDKLKKLENDLKSARKKNNRYHKNIQTSELTISKENDKISAIEKELAIMDIRIENSSTALSVMDEGEEKKVKQSELKDLQKKKSNLLKDIHSAENRISKANTTIKDKNNDIGHNDALQREMGELINQQKLVVAKFQKKLSTIEAY